MDRDQKNLPITTNVEVGVSDSNIPFHADAKIVLTELSDSHARALIHYSKGEALRANNEIILTNDVRAASELIKRKARRSKWNEVTILFASFIMGISAESFLTELDGLSAVPPEGNAILVAVYALVFFISGLSAAVAITRS